MDAQQVKERDADLREDEDVREEDARRDVRGVRPSEGLQGLIEFARRSVPELRRNIETLEPLREGGPLARLRRAKERIDWTRLPGLRPRDETRPREKLQIVIAKRLAFFVLVPTALMAFYLFVFASNQYVATAQFAIRGDVEPMGEAPGSDFAGLIQKHNSQDTFIVRDFIQSRAMAEDAEATLRISKMFSRQEADFWARYRDPQPVERLTRYWRRHVTAQIDLVSGVITLNVRAFTPEDAVAISELVIARSERLVNQISRRAQADILTHAEKDSRAAEERLKSARLALQTFRNTWGIIDPLKTAEGTLQMIAGLRKDKFKAENDLKVLRESRLDEKTRGIQTLIATLAVTDEQIKQLQDQLTTEGLNAGAPNNMTQALLEFEGLKIEQTIAEKLNESLRLLLDRARIAASKQQVYIVTFVPPALPSWSAYPARWYVLGITAFCAFVLWAVTSLLISGVKDQRL